MSAQRGLRLVVIALLVSVLLAVLAANVAVVRDALAVVIAVGCVAGFFGLRLIAFRVREREEGEFEFERPGLFWVGTGGTADEIADRYGRPGGSPILPAHASKGTALPEVVPTYDGHPLGQGSSDRRPA